MGDIVRNIIKLVRDALTPDPQRRDVLPVLSAIAEALMPSRPEKASEARRQGQLDLAVFHGSSGKQQPSHMKEVLYLVEVFYRRLCSPALTLASVLQVVARINRDLTPESQKELYL